jgi:hypothetical protein
MGTTDSSRNGGWWNESYFEINPIVITGSQCRLRSKSEDCKCQLSENTILPVELYSAKFRDVPQGRSQKKISDGGSSFFVWDRGAGGAKRPRARPKAVLGEGAGRGRPLPQWGSGGITPGIFLKICMQNNAFWCPLA